jgi:hypothetical protein
MMSPREFRWIESLTAEYVRRKRAGIPLTKRLPPPVSPLLKALQSSTSRRLVEFAQINAKLAAMKSDVDRQAAARAERERAALAKSIAQTQALIKSNPDRKPTAYVAEIQRQFEALVTRLGVKL